MTTAIKDEQRARYRGKTCPLFWGSKGRMEAFSNWLDSQPADGTFASDDQGRITCNGRPYPFLSSGDLPAGLGLAARIANWLNDTRLRLAVTNDEPTCYLCGKPVTEDQDYVDTDHMGWCMASAGTSGPPKTRPATKPTSGSSTPATGRRKEHPMTVTFTFAPGPAVATVPAGTPLECNRCNQEFPAPRDVGRDRFAGHWAARIVEALTCPHCGETDTPWVDSKHIVPQFDGAKPYRQWKMETHRWLQNN